ncbi:hypothetical protein OS189_04975 [Sulfitobacter sp. F26169L]|uniref:hypothetical protein n=1 Tax=Sulfitobacter sp. F26169L TaxID=2996015 RepID=UPI00226099E2|nr:hypothetical protein [Sulfitobacter sp. F26169L]MCX7565689.1 hypothetical protein [Sulfitobacter sp. F26169L]
MRHLLPSRFVGTFTGAAIAMATFTVAPAYADDDRTARAIATILGLAVVGAIIHDNRQDKKKDHVRYKEPVRTYPKATTQSQGIYNGKRHHGGNAHQQGYNPPRHNVTPKPLPHRVNRKLLPQGCLRSFETRKGNVRMFGRRCLERHYRQVNRLPQSCFQRVRTFNGKRSGYGARCLSQNGYRLARR